MVFAYEDGTWTATEDDDPVGEESRFANAVTSDNMDDEGDYMLAFLAAETYDLVVAGYNGRDFGEVLGFIPDVVVTSGPTPTIMDINTGILQAIP